jgi:hypothetical protein
MHDEGVKRQTLQFREPAAEEVHHGRTAVAGKVARGFI